MSRSQGAYKALMPQGKGQLMCGEAPLTMGMLSWGKVPEHWDGHKILTRRRWGSVCVEGKRLSHSRSPGHLFWETGEHHWGSGWVGSGHGGQQAREFSVWTLLRRVLPNTCRENEALLSSFPLDAVNSQSVVRATAGPASRCGQAEVGTATIVH